MYNIPSILSSEELLDKAFRRATKINIDKKGSLISSRETSIARIDTVSSTITSSLRRFVNSFPSMENLPEFYTEVWEMEIGIDRLKKSLGALEWAISKTIGFSKQGIQKVKRSDSTSAVIEARKSSYGRISSIIYQIENDLELLRRSREIMKDMIEVDLSGKTIVVCGCPNVGKSQIVRALSSGKPIVASYPFTTKKISGGHIDHNRRRYQIIDTPGLLDRPLSDKNEIEKKAILSIKHIPGMILFVFDPSETCGYTMEEQNKVFDSLKDVFKDKKILVIENKKDILCTETPRLKVDAMSGEGLDSLLEEIILQLES